MVRETILLKENYPEKTNKQVDARAVLDSIQSSFTITKCDENDAFTLSFVPNITIAKVQTQISLIQIYVVCLEASVPIFKLVAVYTKMIRKLKFSVL